MIEHFYGSETYHTTLRAPHPALAKMAFLEFFNKLVNDNIFVKLFSVTLVLCLIIPRDNLNAKKKKKVTLKEAGREGHWPIYVMI